VHRDHRHRRAFVRAFKGLQFAVYRVPVVIAVQQHQVQRRQRGNDIQARATDKARQTREVGLEGAGVEIRVRIDGIQVSRRLLHEIEEDAGAEAGFRTHLENRARPGGCRQGPQNDVPHSDHYCYSIGIRNACRPRVVRARGPR
jgi:phosphatidylserine/phosphatidylglycerophosphate/cardiolipin synthase-like enzyme